MTWEASERLLEATWMLLVPAWMVVEPEALRFKLLKEAEPEASMEATWSPIVL